jgi:hypothetical protein
MSCQRYGGHAASDAPSWVASQPLGQIRPFQTPPMRPSGATFRCDLPASSKSSYCFPLSYVVPREKKMATMTGRCLCGQVHYTVTGDPAFSGICHCRNCQRYTGSAFETVVAFPSETIKVQGELKTYQDTGDSGQPVFRRFCPNCGSGVIADVNVLPGVTLVLAGTLDDPAAFTPTMEVFCSSAQPWMSTGGERARFPKMPTG